jgi:aspartyl-tRNA(Asn)/glutamyl-tRNA(Gln) amidotransferase subunit A
VGNNGSFKPRPASEREELQALRHLPGGLDPEDAALLLGEPRPRSGAGRLVVCPDLHLVPLAPAVESALEDAAEALAAGGAHVEERGLPEAALVDPTFRVVQSYEAVRVHRGAGLWPARADDYGADVRRRLEYGDGVTDDDYSAALADLVRLRAGFDRLLGDGAVLLTPVSAVPPPRADDEEARRSFRGAVIPLTSPQNLAGLPSCAVRAGFDDHGLPVGVQLSAAPGRDDAVLAAAHTLHAATPDVQRRQAPLPTP